MNVKQKMTLLKSFFESQFGYCPLVWMFCSGGVNNKINHLHVRALRTIYKDDISTLKNYLKRMIRIIYIIKTSNHLPSYYLKSR